MLVLMLMLMIVIEDGSRRSFAHAIEPEERIDATQPGGANPTMIEHAGVASSFVGNRAGDRELRSGICPDEERTHSAARCT